MSDRGGGGEIVWGRERGGGRDGESGRERRELVGGREREEGIGPGDREGEREKRYTGGRYSCQRDNLVRLREIERSNSFNLINTTHQYTC